MIFENLNPAWQACFTEAWSAYCRGSLPIGAVVASSTFEIIGRGRNRLGDKEAEPGKDLVIIDNELAHAEINALLSLRYSWRENLGLSYRGWGLYTTLEPCPQCMGAFFMSGVRNLFFAGRDPYAGSTNLLGKTSYMSKKPIIVNGPDPELEKISVAMCVESKLRNSFGAGVELLHNVWRKEMPQAVALGEKLFEEKSLLTLSEKGMDVAAVFDLLEHEK